MSFALRRTGVFLAVVLFMAGGDGRAAEWGSVTTVGSSAEYNTNPRMTSQKTNPATGLVASLALDIGRRTESSSLDLTSRVLASRYSSDQSLDSDDVYLNADYALNTERSLYAMNANYSYAGALAGEYVASGFADVNVPSEVYGLRGSARHNLSERMQLFGSLGYQDVSFENGLRYGLVDYQFLTGLAYAQRSLSERTSVNLIARLAQQNAPQTDSESRSVSLGLGLDRQWTERWGSSLAIGPTSSVANGRSNGISTSYRATLAGKWPRSNLDARAERLLSPIEGRGTLQVRDSVSASVRHELMERLVANAYASVDHYSNPGRAGNRVRGNLTYASAAGALDWQPAADWTVTLSYRYLRQDEEAVATGSQLAVGVTWRGFQRTVSR
jgi:hypothetical protein